MKGVLITAVLGVLGGACHAAAGAAEPQVLTRVADIRALSRGEAQGARPVRVRGVVTLRDMFASPPEWLILDDGEQGIWVDWTRARNSRVWTGNNAKLASAATGDVLEVEGVTHPGNYAPVIVPRSVTAVGSGPLPEARRLAVEQLLTGAEDCQRVEVEGVVQGMSALEPDTHRIRLSLRVQGHDFQVRVERWPGMDPAQLIDAEVRVRGIFSPMSNFRSEMVAMRVWIAGPEDVQMIKPPPVDPFAARRVTLDRLLPFSAAGVSEHRCVTRGIVTFCSPGAFCFVQDGDVAVKVEAPGVNVAVGERVEISGFVNMSRLVASLHGAVVRSLGKEASPVPVPVTAAALLNPQSAVDWKRVIASDFDGRLVKLKGRLRGVAPGETTGNWQFQLENTGPNPTAQNTTAYLVGVNQADGALVRAWAEDSLVEVTGVCELSFMSFANSNIPEARSFRLWLRSPQDVQIVQIPPWWTARRLGLAALGLAVVLFLVSAWVMLLRRTVRRQSVHIEESLRHHRDAELEAEAAKRERLRLAGDLHDGVHQLLGAAAFRLESVQALTEHDPAGALRQLTAAQSALGHGRHELRSVMWGIYELATARAVFSDLLAEALGRMDHWPVNAVHVVAHGVAWDLPPRVAGSLLLFVQEAVGNAFRHGAASRVDVTVDFTPEAFAITVCDHGCGFDPAAPQHSDAGHLGIGSMRRRVESLSGTFTLTSAPGRGTTVHAKIPAGVLET